jgi:hypothetical protein
MRLISEIDVWLIIIILTYWVFLISDTSARIILAIIVGLTSGFVYRFLIKKEEKIMNLTGLPISSKTLLLVLFLILLITFFTSPINDVYLENWFVIPATNWIHFITVNAFCTFIPGFILTKLVDHENTLPARAKIVLSILLSIFFTSLFWYAIKMAALTSDLANILFLLVHFTLIIAYLVYPKKHVKHNAGNSARLLSRDVAVTLGLLVLLSVIFVYVQQFIYNPFIRGDNWGYLATSNYIDKGVAFLEPVGKFYSVNPLSTYSLFSLALFRLSGFPPVNSMMIASLIVAALIPLAFYTMSLQYVKNKKLSMLSALIYVAVSGFGWVPFVLQKVGVTVQQYSPQFLLSFFGAISPTVLNDISQPQGAIPEGFKTYILASLAIIMLLYLLASKLPSKARIFLIGAMSAFVFQVHIEEALVFFFTFLPAYVIFSRKDMSELRKDVVAVALGVLVTFVIGFSCPNYWVFPLLLNYALIVLVFGLILGYTFVKKHIQIKLPSHKLGYLKLTVSCLVCYLYVLSVIVLVFYGYENMYYGSAVVYQGFTFPWYYYPLSFGIVGVLAVIGFLMDFQKHRTITYFLVTTIFVFVFGMILSYVNVNFFFTGTKEWRIIYRILPIPASLFAGWALYKLMHFFENACLHLQFQPKLGNIQNRIKLNLRYLSTILFIIVIALGVPSTILASEYWMITDVTPYGRADLKSYDLELVNFLYQNVPITSRVATLSSRSNAIIRLAGVTTAVPSVYPNLFVMRPETIALLSSDVCYICIDKETDTELIDCELVNYLPLVFNNSRYMLYELPYLEPPSESTVGYITPLKYTNRTLLSYIITTSLNSSYQLVTGDIYDKSVMILPSDLPKTERNVLFFDGIDSYVDFGNKYNMGSGDLSVEVWFKTSVSGQFMSLVNKRRTGAQEVGYRIVVTDGNKINAELNDGNGTVAASGQLPNDGNWHQVVAVYDRDNWLCFYVDGLLAGTVNISAKTGNIVTDCNLTLGSQEGEGMFFNGSLSEVRIYDRALSKEEITSNYDEFESPVRNDLILWVPLDEGNETVVYDFNENIIGLLHGGTWNYEHMSLSEIYPVEPSTLLDWVENGGELVIFGGEGALYELFEFEIGDYTNATEIRIGSKSYRFEIPNFETLNCDTDVTILSYYSFDSLNVSPFIVQKKIGQGSIFYVHVDPIYGVSNSQQISLSDTACLGLIIRDSLENAGSHLSSVTNTLSRFPLEKRWIGTYVAYGENNFVAKGDITINSTLSGLSSLQQSITADTIFITSNNTETVLQNVTITAINVIGEAVIEVNSNACGSFGQKINLIPCYIPFQFENCVLQIKPLNNSTLEIQLADGGFSIDNGVIIVNSKSAQLVLEKPFIVIDGNVSFTKVSLPSTDEAWTNNAQLVGNLSFHIGYGDKTYFFCDQFKDTYVTTTNVSSIVDSIPWQDIITSIPHLLVVGIIMALSITKIKESGMKKHA